MFIVRVPGVNNSENIRGCERGGISVLESLKNISTNERGAPIDTRLFDLEEIHLDNNDLKLTHNLIEKNSLETFENKPKTIFLGGDQSISFSLVKTFLKYCEDYSKEPCLIVFDAHPDCLESYDDFPKNREWLRSLIEGGFPAENLFVVGLRNAESSELTFLSKNNIKRMNMASVVENVEDSCDALMEFCRDKEVYISIDLDVLDPSFAPGVQFKEPGGFTTRQLIYFVQRLSKMKNLRAVDIVEINPLIDVENLTSRVGAKILSEFV